MINKYGEPPGTVLGARNIVQARQVPASWSSILMEGESKYTHTHTHTHKKDKFK